MGLGEADSTAEMPERTEGPACAGGPELTGLVLRTPNNGLTGCVLLLPGSCPPLPPPDLAHCPPDSELSGAGQSYTGVCQAARLNPTPPSPGPHLAPHHHMTTEVTTILVWAFAL